jgi:hypothetical protein
MYCCQALAARREIGAHLHAGNAKKARLGLDRFTQSSKKPSGFRPKKRNDQVPTQWLF